MGLAPASQPVRAAFSPVLHGRDARATHGRDGHATRGFTLIEMMVVILILAVLVTLVVGISKSIMIEVARRRTVTIQDQVLAAIRVYTEVKGAPPAQAGTTAYVTGYGNPSTTGGPYAGDWNARVRNSELYKALIAEPACAKLIQSLPPEAVYSPTLPFREKPPGYYKLFRDGFDNDMDYTLSGLGGRPVLISGGPDGHFGTVSGKDYDADNIFSDGRGK